MLSVSSYRKLAPFSMRDLVDSANSLLRYKPDLALTHRVVRFYVSKGLLPPPEGSPKMARYSYKHLLALLAIRGLQDRGVNLDRIAADLIPLWHGNTDLVERVIDEWLQNARPDTSEESLSAPFRDSLFEESPVEYKSSSWDSRESYARRRFQNPSTELQREIQELRAQVIALRDELSSPLKGMDSGRVYSSLFANEDLSDYSLSRRRGMSEFEELKVQMRDLAHLVRQLADEVKSLKPDSTEE